MNFEIGGKLRLALLEQELTSLKSKINKKEAKSVLFDFSLTTWFDIASLLFLICLFNYLRILGIEINIVLPEGDSESKYKARDFLKRWRFFETLDDNVDKIENLIPERQLVYLGERQKYYLPAEIKDPFGNIATLLSSKLVEITSFAKIVEQRRAVSIKDIMDYIDLLEKTTIRPVIEKTLGIKNIEVFTKSIIKESLLNTEEHPEATISLLGMSREGTNLVIGVADNGKGIPETLRETYLDYLRKTHKKALTDSDLILFAFEKQIIEYSTWEGTTSIKKEDPRYKNTETERGKGLYYLKKQTLDLGGQIKVRSGKAFVTFIPNQRPIGEQVSEFKGTLIKILLPIRT